MAAGKQAYKAFPKHSKKVLILQMAKWWERKDGQVVCANQQVVNAIATFLDPSDIARIQFRYRSGSNTGSGRLSSRKRVVSAEARARVIQAAKVATEREEAAIKNAIISGIRPRGGGAEVQLWSY